MPRLVGSIEFYLSIYSRLESLDFFVFLFFLSFFFLFFFLERRKLEGEVTYNDTYKSRECLYNHRNVHWGFWRLRYRSLDSNPHSQIARCRSEFNIPTTFCFMIIMLYREKKLVLMHQIYWGKNDLEMVYT